MPEPSVPPRDLVLIDTTAWIEFFRRQAPGRPHEPVADVVDRLLRDDRVASPGVVRAELLQGARSVREKESLGRQLAATHDLPDPPDLWARVADLGYALRRKGHDVRIPDLVIAAVAQAYDVPVLTLDRHFTAIASVAPLRLQAPIS